MFSLLSVFAYECIHKVEDVEGVLFGIVIWDSSSTDLTVFQSKIILDPTAGTRTSAEVKTRPCSLSSLHIFIDSLSVQICSCCRSVVQWCCEGVTTLQQTDGSKQR